MLLRTFFLFLLAALGFGAHAQTPETLIVGNCSTNGDSRLEYVGREAGTGYAVHFSRYKMRAYAGAQMDAISIQFDDDARGYIFVSHGVNDEPLYTQTFEAERGWNEILLDTPFAIDGSELTFGFVVESLTSGTFVIGDALVEGNEYINRGSGWTAFSGGSACLTARLSGSSLPAHDVALGRIAAPAFLRVGDEGAAVKAEVANLGLATVQSLSFSIHTGGNEVSTVLVDGLAIAPRSRAEVSVPLCLNADGDYTLWAEITEVNGESDAAPIDNASTQHEVVARSDFHERNVLLEVFSTERCTNCPAGHQTIDYALGSTPRLIELTHHAGFFTDKFTISESIEYEWFYKSPQYSTTFAPAFMTDRTAWSSLPDYYPYGTPVAMSLTSKSLKAAYAEAAAIPALANISIDPHYDPTTRSLSFDVEAEALVATEGYRRPALNVFLVEHDVFSKTQENSFGSYRHPHLVRQCLTSAWGEAFAAGGSISRHYNATLPEDWEADNVSIVAFVANHNPTDNTDCRVMNAEEAKLQSLIVGIESIEAEGTCRPFSLGESADVKANNATPLYNVLGQRCSPTNLPGGVYICPNHKTTKLFIK